MGLLGASAAKKAAGIQADAANKATDTQLAMYKDAKGNLQPFTDAGKGATYTLAAMYGLPTPQNPGGSQPFNDVSLAAFRNSPDYKFAMDEAINKVNAEASARGQLLSGNQLDAVTRTAEGVATGNFGNYITELNRIASLGESAGSQTGNFSIETGKSVAANTIAAGDAQASGVLGQFKSLSSGANNAFNNLGLVYQQQFGSGGAYGNPTPTGIPPTAGYPSASQLANSNTIYSGSQPVANPGGWGTYQPGPGQGP